jgi:hypothetical protein
VLNGDDLDPDSATRSGRRRLVNQIESRFRAKPEASVARADEKPSSAQGSQDCVGGSCSGWH